ncbi:KN motif and ankyrin repeat domain-containing protein 1a [Aplochiton taeniatus]
MSQAMHINVIASEKGERCPFPDDKAAVAPFYVETPYGYQLDLDFLKYVDDIERGNTIKKLNIQRKPKVAKSLELPRYHAEWCSAQAVCTSIDSPSSYMSEEGNHSPVFFSSLPQPASPLSPTLSPTLTRAAPVDEFYRPHSILSLLETKPQLTPPSPRVSLHHNPLVEKTLMETRWRLEQERLHIPPPGDLPITHHRLASFGGLGSSSCLSVSHGPSQISPICHTLQLNGHQGNGELNPYYTPSIGSSIRHSPISSGMTTPIHNVSPLHLQHIREQMVVALKRLKELEEQTKTIPILQVKIAVLQEEKRLANAKSKKRVHRFSGEFRKRSYSVDSADQLAPRPANHLEAELHIVEPEAQEMSIQQLEEFQQLAVEVQTLDMHTRNNEPEIRKVKADIKPHGSHEMLISMAADENIKNVTIAEKKSTSTVGPHFRDTGVMTELHVMQSKGVGVSEDMLGVNSEAEAEIQLQLHTIDELKEKICQLEVQLKETTQEMEIGKLKLELKSAGEPSRKKADKSSMARPEMYCASVEAKVQTHNQGVGCDLELSHASTAKTFQAHSVGVSCHPTMCNIGVGSEVSMDKWVVHLRMEVNDKCVGRQVDMCHQSSGPEIQVCEVGVNTLESVNNLCEVIPELKKESRSIGCGEYSVDVTKELMTQETEPVLINKMDCGVTVTSEMATQQTNTPITSVSKFTNTEKCVLADSSTNTLLNTCEKHTSMAIAETRSVAIGEGLVKDSKTAVNMRSIAVGTTAKVESPTSKSSTSRTTECGVGLIGIEQNFLVGLKTRSIGCGPYPPVDLCNTRSVNSSVSTVRAAPQQMQPHGVDRLDHYIERVQKLLEEQQMLLAENYSELADAFGQPHSQFGSINSELVHTLTSINSVMKYGSVEEVRDILELHVDSASINTDGGQPLHSASEVSSDAVTSRTKGFEVEMTVNPEDRLVPFQQQLSSTTKQKIRMDQQRSSALHGKLCSQGTLKSIMKKKDGRPGSNGAKKNLQFVGVNAGYDTTSSDGSVSEESSSSGSEEEEDKKEYKPQKVNRNLEGQTSSEEFGNNVAVKSERNQGEGSPVMQETEERYELSERMLAACNVLKTHLNDPMALINKDVSACGNTVQHEWFRVSSQKSAIPSMVEDYLLAFLSVSPAVLFHVVNMADSNGNTALHYSVSHSNFNVVKKLLDADVCNVNQPNKAGYTPIMLAALAAVETMRDMQIVEELFSKGDVNARASQAGQTGLMLAVSHGRKDMVRALLAQGAEVNIQDDEGSTALMCASEHGHVAIVKLLLAQPGCDATLSDSDESSALSIALEAGHKDIAVLLYAHVNFSKAQSPGTPRLSRKMSPSPTRRGIFD